MAETTTEIDALLISETELREASGVALSDPLLAVRGGRAKHALVAAAAGLVGGLTTAFVAVQTVQLPGAIAAACVIATLVVALVEWEEAVAIGLLASLASLGWFVYRLLGAGLGAVAFVLGISIAIAAICYVVARRYRSRRRARLGYDVLSRLLESIRRHNDLVRALSVRERLARAQGAAADDAELAPVLAAIRTMRENLVRALTVQRILRENRDVLEQAGRERSEDLVPIDALRIEGEAEHYRDVVGETVKLAAEVQEAYDSLREGKR
jgi:hypothetical protein